MITLILRNTARGAWAVLPSFPLPLAPSPHPFTPAIQYFIPWRFHIHPSFPCPMPLPKYAAILAIQWLDLTTPSLSLSYCPSGDAGVARLFCVALIPRRGNIKQRCRYLPSFYCILKCIYLFSPLHPPLPKHHPPTPTPIPIPNLRPAPAHHR